MPRTCPSSTDTPRRLKRTPADLKWLLNERAALAGENRQLHCRITQLHTRLAKLETLRQRLTEDLRARQARLAQTTQLIAALDATLGQAHPDANPCAGGTVKAWAGRYGQRGALRTFLADSIQAAGHHGITTTELIEGAISRFGLHVGLPSERASVRNSVKTILRALHKDGVIDSTSRLQPNGHPLNHWRPREALTLGDLRSQAQQAFRGSASDATPGSAPDLGTTEPNDDGTDPNAHAVRGEVVGQRAGRREG